MLRRGVTYAQANPENIRPLFTPDHIHNAVTSTPPNAPTKWLLRASAPLPSVLSTLLDMEVLRSNILDGLLLDAEARTCLETLPHIPDPENKWSRSLLHDGAVYVPNNGDLRTCGPASSRLVMTIRSRAIRARRRPLNSSAGTTSGQRCVMM